MLRKNKSSFWTVKSYQVFNLSVLCKSLKLRANLRPQITHLWFDQSITLCLVNICFLISSNSLNLDLKTLLTYFTSTSTVNLSSVENISERADTFSFLKTLVLASYNCLKVTRSKYFTWLSEKCFKSYISSAICWKLRNIAILSKFSLGSKA